MSAAMRGSTPAVGSSIKLGARPVLDALREASGAAGRLRCSRAPAVWAVCRSSSTDPEGPASWLVPRSLPERCSFVVADSEFSREAESIARERGR